MKTISINLYKFNELSREAQEKAINDNLDINLERWWESDYEDAEQIGLKITSFDLDRWQIEGELITSTGECVEEILKQHGKMCETYKTAKQYKNAFQHTSDEGDIDDLDNTENQFLNAILKEYLNILKKDYYFYTTTEAIKETLESNDYDFTEEGKIYFEKK